MAIQDSEAPIPWSSEEDLATKLMKLTRKEGHRSKLPRNNTKHHVPPPSRVRQEIVDHFALYPEPISTNQLLNHVDAQPPNLRRVCRDMVKEGLMRSERTVDGCIYTFVGDISKDDFELS